MCSATNKSTQMLDKIYARAPYFIKVLMLNFKAFLNSRKRYSSGFNQYLEEYKSLWQADSHEIEAYQKVRLIDLLLEAKRYVPYYTDIFSQLNIADQDIRESPLKVMASLPLLTKSNRKNEVDRLVNTNPVRTLKEVGYTSGTSGTPTKNYLDLESIERAFALWKRFHWTIGIDKTMKNVRFSGRIIVDPYAVRKPFWVYNFFEKQMMMSSYHLKTENVKYYI